MGRYDKMNLKDREGKAVPRSGLLLNLKGHAIVLKYPS